MEDTPHTVAVAESVGNAEDVGQFVPVVDVGHRTLTTASLAGLLTTVDRLRVVAARKRVHVYDFTYTGKHKTTGQ